MTDESPLTRKVVEEVVKNGLHPIEVRLDRHEEEFRRSMRDIVHPLEMRLDRHEEEFRRSMRDIVHPLEVRLDRHEVEFHQFRDATLTRLDHLIGLYERSEQERTFTNGTLRDHESRLQALEGRSTT